MSALTGGVYPARRAMVSIKGRTLDIWVPSCAEARRRGRHRATAVLLTRAESRAERAKQRKRDESERLARK